MRFLGRRHSLSRFLALEHQKQNELHSKEEKTWEIARRSTSIAEKLSSVVCRIPSLAKFKYPREDDGKTVENSQFEFKNTPVLRTLKCEFVCFILVFKCSSARMKCGLLGCLVRQRHGWGEVVEVDLVSPEMWQTTTTNVCEANEYCMLVLVEMRNEIKGFLGSFFK